MIELPGDYVYYRRTLWQRLQEAAPSRIQWLTGPRQVGKTTLLLEIAERLGAQAVYAAGDEPEASLPGFFRSAAGRTWKHGRGVVAPCCCWTKCISWATAQDGLRGIGTGRAATTFPFRWWLPGRRRCASLRDDGKAWPDGSSA